MLSNKFFEQRVIPLFLSPKGRISRGLFWKANLVLILGYEGLILYLIIIKQIFGFSVVYQELVSSSVSLIFLYMIIILTTKRLHDLNYSGWWAIPCVFTIVFWFIIGLIAGKSDVNSYGDNPIEFERNRLYINRGTGLPPPPPPLDNSISKTILYTMMFLPTISLVIAGVIIFERMEKPVIKQTEEISSSEKKSLFTEKFKVKNLPFYLQKGDQYQKVEAEDGVNAYYVVTRVDGTIEHYALDGTLQWSNVEHEVGQLLEDDIQPSQSEHNIQEATPSTVLSHLPFVGERGFNFMGGSGTGYTIKINPDGHTQIELCGVDECSNIYNGKYANPIQFDDGSGFLFGDGKIYSVPEHGKVAEEGCQNYESDKCVSDLYSY